MRKVLYFLSGFGLALLLAGLVVLKPFGSSRADESPSTPTVMPTQAATISAPTPTLEAEPSPSSPSFSLDWRREGHVAGSCDHLTIGKKDEVHYSPCREAPRFAQLTAEEFTAYMAYIARYAPFEYGAQDVPGRPNGMTVRLRFFGRGARLADETERAEIAAWAGGVYERLVRDEQRADIVALARVHLSGRLAMSTDAIDTVSVESVTWPDACLGIPSTGMSCAAVLTPGYRIRLAVGEAVYEYHTDLHGLVRPLRVTELPATPTHVAPTPTPAVPTPTSWPTTVPRSSPTPRPTPYPITVTGWLGEYYANPTLSGPPVQVRNDEGIAFDWGYNAPAPGLPSDYFSVRWSRRAHFSEGDYNFKVRADDGARLWVAGNLLVDRWHGGYTEDIFRQHMLEGEHEIIVEYYELEGVAKARMTWEKFYAPPKRTATPTTAPTGEPSFREWRAEYYANTRLKGHPALVRNDERIAFDWGNAAPAPGLPREGFSVRWTRRPAFERGPYRFLARVDGDLKLRVDKRTLIDVKRQDSATLLEGYLWLGAGDHDLRADYVKGGGEARAHVWWERMESFAHWKGEYFRNRDLNGDPVFVRDDAVIAFDWGSAAPGVGLSRNDFSVRWTRTITLPGRRYRFWASADDGIRFIVNGQPLIDEWHSSPGRHYQHETDLPSGSYTLVVEYYERRDSAKVGAGWELLAAATPTATPTVRQKKPRVRPSPTPGMQTRLEPSAMQHLPE